MKIKKFLTSFVSIVLLCVMLSTPVLATGIGDAGLISGGASSTPNPGVALHFTGTKNIVGYRFSVYATDGTYLLHNRKFSRFCTNDDILHNQTCKNIPSAQPTAVSAQPTAVSAHLFGTKKSLLLVLHNLGREKFLSARSEHSSVFNCGMRQYFANPLRRNGFCENKKAGCASARRKNAEKPTCREKNLS